MTTNGKDGQEDLRRMREMPGVIFAQSPDARLIVGVVTNSEPPSLALLSAGVAGFAARRARREQAKSDQL